MFISPLVHKYLLCITESLFVFYTLTMRYIVSINILVVHIPPATPVFVYSHFFEKLELCHIFDANFVLAGDFNVPLLDNQICPLSNCITNFMSSVEAIQINDVLNVNRRRLDLIFCPSSSSFTIKQSDFPLVPEDSHHPALVCNLNFSVEKVKDFEFSKSMMYNFKRTNFVELYNLFLDTDWGIVTECNDVNIACDNLYKIINSYFDKTIPSSFGKRGVGNFATKHHYEIKIQVNSPPPFNGMLSLPVISPLYFPELIYILVVGRPT
jgi:hypothetical protein